VRSRLTYSNVVSTLCLFILLGGGAYAATKLPKNSVGTKQLKNNAVRGSKVADGSLSGADIGGPVLNATSAAQAAHAANSDLLAGAAPSSFYASDNVKRFDVTVRDPAIGSHKSPFLNLGPLSLEMSCGTFGSEQGVSIIASSTAPDGISYSSFVDSELKAGGGLNPLEVPTSIFAKSAVGGGDSGTIQFVYSDASRVISASLGFHIDPARDECRMTGLAIQG
jgi:hypothetical protein